ncbi:hypothetical protein N7451_000616 [Penicillium sp. IBT 35674x]|nr:hypothetical protein N7451_000616 [Penicillium sp. IBT 35674x]
MSNQQSQLDLKTKSVVSCFIFSVEKANAQVALFRRSAKERTYQHHLAPISGSIDAHESPLAAAWREVKEETTLTPQQLELWRHGKPYSFSDVSVGRKWTIHPFAFQLRNTEKDGLHNELIKVNWEHDSWEWHDPGEVVDDDSFGAVPYLAKSLGRVWFQKNMNRGASEALQSCLEELHVNRQSGNHELTCIALKGFRDVLVHLRDDPKWWETTRMTAWHIWKNSRERMDVGTLNALLGALDDIEDIKERDLEDESRWDLTLAVLDHHLEAHRMLPSRIQDSFVEYLQTHFISSENAQSSQKLTILTLSANATIRDSLLDAIASTPISHLDIHILESRPLFEGASMASSLLTESQANLISSPDQIVKVTVHTDASAALASTNVDLVLLGADLISSSGCVSSKTGSLPAVLSAKYISPNAKVLILSGLEKVSDWDRREDRHKLQECDPAEVMSSWAHSGIKGVNILQGLRDFHAGSSKCTTHVENVDFEWVPANLIDGFVCEDGTWDVAKIEYKAQELKQRADRYFGDL